MPQMIRDRKFLLIVVSAFVVLGLWSNAVAALFCPHMMGGNCCTAQKAESASHQHYGDSRSSATHDDMDHMDMSEIGMEMSVSDMEMNGTATPLPSLDRDLLYKIGAETDTQATSGAISEDRGSCSHCEMHSRSSSTFPVSAVGQANVSNEIIAAEATSATLSRSPSVPAFFELHEHGPPGSSFSPVYILISSFRI